jgi:hypothetical protein
MAPVKSVLRARVGAGLCALSAAVCVLMAWPFAEMGMGDDFSYIRSAQVLADTGHIALNGWGAPMAIFQLLPAALFIKLFGFSFTIVRLTTLLVAMATAFLFQRAMVRAGINEWNATAGTLTLALSPMYLQLSFSFFTDMWCLFAIVFCFYACLHALQAQTSRAAVVWICSASIGNAIFGTVRQVAFLGVLVMVPCTLWLLRKRKQVLPAGIAACAAGYAIVLYALYWFSKQPFSVALPIRPTGLHTIHMDTRLRNELPNILLRPALEIPMLMLPVLLMFLPAMRRSSRLAKAGMVGSSIFLFAIGLHMLRQAGTLSALLVPFVVRIGSILSWHGMFTVWPMMRILNPVWPDIGLPKSFRIMVALATIVGILCLQASFSLRKRTQSTVTVTTPLQWRSLAVLVVPFLLAYTVALAPTGLVDGTLDRYLLPLVAIGMVLVVRHYQETVRTRLPIATFLLVFLIAGITVPALHDLFSMYRATLAAANEMRAAGVPRDQIDAGLEYNGWTQITEAGFIPSDGVRLPPGVSADRTITDNLCPITIPNWLPKIKPQYSLSFQQHDCGGQADFAPVIWHRWLGLHRLPIYIVKNPVIPGSHLCWVSTFQKDPATFELTVKGCAVN